MSVGGQLFNLNRYNAVPPRSVRVWLEYGRDGSYGRAIEAEIRELLTHVPVWDGKPGVLKASRTLNADQFFVHAHLSDLEPGSEYHYRFRYASGREAGATPDATFTGGCETTGRSIPATPTTRRGPRSTRPTR